MCNNNCQCAQYKQCAQLTNNMSANSTCATAMCANEMCAKSDYSIIFRFRINMHVFF